MEDVDLKGMRTRSAGHGLWRKQSDAGDRNLSKKSEAAKTCFRVSGPQRARLEASSWVVVESTSKHPLCKSFVLSPSSSEESEQITQVAKS